MFALRSIKLSLKFIPGGLIYSEYALAHWFRSMAWCQAIAWTKGDTYVSPEDRYRHAEQLPGWTWLFLVDYRQLGTMPSVHGLPYNRPEGWMIAPESMVSWRVGYWQRRSPAITYKPCWSHETHWRRADIRAVYLYFCTLPNKWLIRQTA